jgi:hypothetical protein
MKQELKIFKKNKDVKQKIKIHKFKISKKKKKKLNWPIINRLDNSHVDKIPIRNDRIKKTGHEKKN